MHYSPKVTIFQGSPDVSGQPVTRKREEHPEPDERHITGTLLDLLEKTAGIYPGHGIYHIGSGNREGSFQSYKELLTIAKKMSQVLQRKGLRPGMPLILAIDGSRDFLSVFWGCLFCGALPAPLAHMRIPRAESMEAKKIYHVWQLTKAPVVVDASNERCFAALEQTFKGAGAEIMAVENLLNEAAITDFQDMDLHSPSHEDTTLLQFTSGSTGMPKGAKLTHRNLIANVKALHYIENARPEDVMVSWLPYFHDFGLFGCHIMPMLAGMDQVKMDPFQFAQRPFLWMETIHKHRATITASTNTGIEYLCNYMELRPDRLPEADLSCLKVWTLGAEMISADSCRRLQNLLAPKGLAPNMLMPGYGLTETTLVATCHPRNTPIKSFLVNRDRLINDGKVIYEEEQGKGTARFTSVGLPVPYCRVRVTDMQGRALGHSRVGEVEIQGDNVIAGYYLNPEATAASYNGKWFRTGDLGFTGVGGELCIVGRCKEIIIVRGQNYYPADIENMALAGMENSFRLVVACGVFDAALGRELALLFYVPAQKNPGDALSPLLQRMNEQLTSFAGFSIDHFICVRQNDIPRTSSGKIIRRELCEAFLDGRFAAMITRIARVKPEVDPATMDHESVVVEVWSKVLDLPPEAIAGGKNVFRLGADSIRAMRIQAGLEEIYRAKMESNFCYIYPTVAQQVQYFRNRDFSIEPPQNELEAILQKIAASVLGMKNEKVGVSADLMPLLGDMSQIFALSDAIRDVFHNVDIGEDFRKLGTIQRMAEYLWPRVFPNKKDPDTSEYFPLMHFQETLYFHRKGFVRNEPSGLSCYIYLNARMECVLNKALFDKAFNFVIGRHPVLRSVIDEGGEKPRFRVLESTPEFRTRHVQKLGLSEDEQREYTLQRGMELNDHRFDLTEWPLFFCEVTQFSENTYLFAMNIDHMLVDGFSCMQVFDELFNTYDRMALGEKWELPITNMSFGDYVRVENIRQRTQEYKKALEFQIELFKDLPPKAQLPSKQNPALLKEVFFDTYYQEIQPDILEGLNAVAGEEQVSLNSLLLAAYFKLMNIWCRQDDMIINMPVFNREQYFAGARKTVGSFIDIFPVRLRTWYKEPLIGLARKAEAFTRKLLEVPVSSIELSREIFSRQGLRATSMSSLIFSNSIGMYAGEVSGMKSVRLDTPEFRTGAPGTYLDLVIYDYRVRREDNDVYYFNWNFIRDLFDREFIEILAGQYLVLLKQLVHQAGEASPLFEGRDILPASYRVLLDTVNATKAPVSDATLHALISQQAARTPEKTALTCEGRQMSYAEFDALSDRVAGLLRELGLSSHDFAALYMPRNLDMPVAQLGIMKSSAAYLPMDVDFPPERVAYILEDSGAKALFVHSSYLERIPRVPDHVAHIVIMNPDAQETDIPAALRSRVIMPEDGCREREFSVPAQSASAPAYMIYTSGSTGKPKGAKISHRNIVNFLTWVKEAVGISEDEQCAFVTSYAFDMTMTSNWTPFLCGACLHILPEEKTRDVNTLLHFVSEKGITFLNVTPSHLSLLAGAREYLGDIDLPMHENMRIMLGGEVISTQDLNLWLRYYPGHSFINEYGPTETTVASTWFPIPKETNNRVELSVVPIGKPVYNTQVYVLNGFGEYCMPGVPGELYIGGEGVSLGYHNRPEKNAAAFVPSPFNPGEILYRTGDVVRMREDGNIEFLGREDHQINLRGYRIEAGEIESALREHPDIVEAVVAPRKDTSGSLALVAFHTGNAVDSSVLRAHLATMLPEYMIPVHFEYLEAMPCTPSGKLDKNGLPEVRIEAGKPGGASVPPTTDLEKRVTRVWEEVLGITGLGVTDNFWDVGGDSLKAMRLIVRMKKEGFIDFGLREAFAYQTVGSIVERLQSNDNGEGREESAAEGLVILSGAAVPRVRLYCLPYACGNPAMYRDFSSLLPEDCMVMAANLPGHGRTGDLPGSIGETADLCLEQLASLHDGTPLILLGYSFGGYLAYEIARRLEEQGKAPAGLILVACPPPGVTGGLKGILASTDEEVIRFSRETYNYDFSAMTSREREEYMRTLRADTAAMLDFSFTGQIAAPALAIVGENEEEKELLTMADEWGKICAAVRHCRTGGAHMLIKTHTGPLADAVREFIGTVVG